MSSHSRSTSTPPREHGTPNPTSGLVKEWAQCLSWPPRRKTFSTRWKSMPELRLTSRERITFYSDIYLNYQGSNNFLTELKSIIILINFKMVSSIGAGGKVYFEKQGEDMLCGLHCINAMLQGPIFDEISLS